MGAFWENALSGSLELFFLQLDGPTRGWWETVTHEACCLCPVYSIILFWLLSLLHRVRMLEMEANFLVFLWQSQAIQP